MGQPVPDWQQMPSLSPKEADAGLSRRFFDKQSERLQCFWLMLDKYWIKT